MKSLAKLKKSYLTSQQVASTKCSTKKAMLEDLRQTLMST